MQGVPSAHQDSVGSSLGVHLNSKGQLDKVHIEEGVGHNKPKAENLFQPFVLGFNM